MQPSQARKLARDSRHIHGWFEAHGLFALIDSAQRDAGVHGDLFEIGAHHGKSAVMLGRMASADETIAVCDIFGEQDLNASRSGSGDRATFDSNMARFAPGREVRVHQCLSSDLEPNEVGAFRFFHIDGGHLAEEALSDLRLGAQVTLDGGAIVVDDPFRIEWPGVTEAILTFLTEHDDWVPVALGFNKLVICRKPSLGFYTAAVESDDAWSYIDPRVFERKRLPIALAETTIFFVPSYRQFPALPAAVARIRWLYNGVRARLRC